MDNAKPSIEFGKYALAFFIFIAALALGNLLGFVVTSLWGWQNLEYSRPGGVGLSVVQAWMGTLLVMFGCSHFLHHPRFGSFWLKIYVAILGLVVISLGALAIWLNDYGNLFSWNTMSTIASLAVTEASRRYFLKEFV